MGPSWEKTIRGVTGDTWGQKGKQGVDGAVDVPGVHVGGGGHDLGGAHLLHALQRLLLVLLVNEMRRRAIPRDLKTAKIRLN